VTIATAKLRGAGAGVAHIRLYEMTLPQRTHFDAAARSLALEGKVTAEQADKMVEHLVVGCLSGRFGRKPLPKAIRELSNVFPRLTSAQVEALPVFGCPDGDVVALVLQLTAKDGSKRTVRYDMDDGQQAWFADAMRRAIVVGGESRDQAWFNLTVLVGRLICGGTLKKDADFLVLIGSGYFPALTVEQAMALPVATEDDVRRLTFRDIKPKGAGIDGSQ